LVLTYFEGGFLSFSSGTTGLPKAVSTGTTINPKQEANKTNR
jgi:acyl-coenzyme A synthetase/AMP-(fatty) acid ligase